MSSSSYIAANPQAIVPMYGSLKLSRNVPSPDLVTRPDSIGGRFRNEILVARRSTQCDTD